MKWHWRASIKGQEAPAQVLVVYDRDDEVVQLQGNRLTIRDGPATFWAMPDEGTIIRQAAYRRSAK